MTNEIQRPISNAIRQEKTAETLLQYRNGFTRADDEYAPMVERYYKLVTDFYEFGWGQSFHFAPSRKGDSLEESIANHQRFLGDALDLKPGMNVLDVGCGVGGPQRSLAKKYGATVTGLNISEYQLQKCAEYNEKSGLAELCHVLLGDFMAVPADDESFDAAYHIEAIAHAPDKKTAYEELFRVLKPGAIFAGYEWCMTPSYDANKKEHREIKEAIEYGNALPQIASFSDVENSLQSAGFELIETNDRAFEADSDTPWYRPLEGSVRTLRGFPRSTAGRKVTSTVLRVLESLRLVPQGAYETQEILNIAADSLVAGGRLGIFTPMYYHKARKPN